MAEPVKSVLIMCVVSVPANTFLGIHSVLHAMALDPSVSYTVGSSISEFLGVKPMAVYPLGKLRAPLLSSSLVIFLHCPEEMSTSPYEQRRLLSDSSVFLYFGVQLILTF